LNKLLKKLLVLFPNEFAINRFAVALFAAPAYQSASAAINIKTPFAIKPPDFLFNYFAPVQLVK